MAIFGLRRIKKIKKKRFVPPVHVKEISDTLEMKAPSISYKPPVAEQKKEYKTGEPSQPTFAPLFVNLARYRQILDTLRYLRMDINSIKNQFSVLSEVDKLREENLKLLHPAINRVCNRLIELDSEFIRPSGFIQEIPELQIQDVKSLERTIADLKDQIEHLKSEVETFA